MNTISFLVISLYVLINCNRFDIEKELLIKMKTNIDNQLKLIDQLNNKQISSLSKNHINSIGESVSLVEINKYDKNLNIISFIDANSLNFAENEEIFGFQLMNYKIKKDNQTKMNIAIILISNLNFYLLSEEGKILFQTKFEYNISLIDFSFDEDNNLIIYSSSDLLIIPISFKFTDVDKAEVTFPSKRIVNMNNNDKAIRIMQHKLHSNKYIVLAYEKGNIFIFTKDLDLRMSLSVQYKIKNIIINNGILGIISDNNVLFVNMLGGNSVLLQCVSYNIIVDAVYDTINNLLFVLDEEANLTIYNTKLSLSKPTSNECNHIYKFTLSKRRFNKGKIDIFKNNLYIMLDNTFIGIVDLNEKNGININRFILNTKLLSYKKNFSNDFNLFHYKDTYMMSKISAKDLIMMKINNFKIHKEKKEGSIIDYLENNILYVYIVILSIVIIYVFYSKKFKQSKIATNDNDEKLLEVLNQLNNYEKQKDINEDKKNK